MIGFGSAEKTFEEDEGKAFRDYVWERYKADRPEYLDGAFSEDVYAWLRARAEGYLKEAEAFTDAENPPDRYAHTYPWVLSDGIYIVAVITFLHVNRRHPMSPDGWAATRNERSFFVRKSDMDDAMRGEGGGVK